MPDFKIADECTVTGNILLKGVTLFSLRPDLSTLVSVLPDQGQIKACKEDKTRICLIFYQCPFKLLITLLMVEFL